MGPRREQFNLIPLLILMASVGLGLAFWVEFRLHPPRASAPLLILLSSLAIIAEFIPVELPRRGIRITFALPYIAAIALVSGPLAAVMVDIFATLAVGIALSKPRASKQWIWHGYNAAMAAACSAVAGALLCSLAPGTAFEVLIGAFTLCYAVVNFACITAFERVVSGELRHERLASNAVMSLLSVALYCLSGIVVAVLLKERFYGMIPLTLIPVWVVRTGILYAARMDAVYYETITALSQMLQHAHPYTHGHLDRVARAAEEVARELGLGSSRSRQVRQAAVLHDIGKIAVDDRILDKPGPLTAPEFDHVKLHAQWGADILSPAKSFAALVPWIRHHHERIDGEGYPDRLPGSQIPLESRIIAVVDAFDAMTGTEDAHRRAYRDPMSDEEALAELKRCAGTQFDEGVVSAFCRRMGGSLK